jgi:hypothetical protein
VNIVATEIETEIKAMADRLKTGMYPARNDPAPAAAGPGPTKPTGGTVLEALEQLEKHAYGILNVAREIEQALIGHGPGDPGTESIAAEKLGGPIDGGIWDKLAAQIVTIERVLAQIDEAHNHSRTSLK